MEYKKYPRIRIETHGDLPISKYVSVFVDNVDITKYVKDVKIHIPLDGAITCTLDVIGECDIDSPAILSGGIRVREN